MIYVCPICKKTIPWWDAFDHPCPNDGLWVRNDKTPDQPPPHDESEYSGDSQ